MGPRPLAPLFLSGLLLVLMVSNLHFNSLCGRDCGLEGTAQGSADDQGLNQQLNISLVEDGVFVF